MSKCFLYCEKFAYPFFEDYIKTFIKQLDLKLIIVEDINSVDFGDGIHFFMSKFPSTAFHQLKGRAVYINMEQLTRGFFLVYSQTLKRYGIKVIDYNEENQKLTGGLILRYQYSEEEISRLSPVEKLYDVAFVGSSSNRRNYILDQLRIAGISVHDVKGWGYDRDREILKAKILVNIHYDNEYNIYETLRCDRFIFASMLVITEDSLFEELLDIRKLFISAKYNVLVPKVVEVLENYDSYLENFLSLRENLLPEIMTSRKSDLELIKSSILCDEE